ncbi:GGDEF domain-containing protein [Hydrogenimonas sp.]
MLSEALYVAAGLLVVATVGAGTAFFQCRKRLKESRIKVEKLEKELMAIRSLDEVTDVFNYPFFVKMANVQIKLARRHKWPVTLLLVDIDQLEKINLRYSFMVGDAVLRHLAESVRSATRSSDVPGRFGGSGIFVLLPECDAENVDTVFERIEQKLHESPLKTGEKVVEYSISAGSATMYGIHAQLNRMLGLSEEALDVAKKKNMGLVKFDKEGRQI